MAINPDSAKQIEAWLELHGIALSDCSTADCERVAKEYHAAIAKEHGEALAENAKRKAPKMWDTIERFKDGRWFLVKRVDADMKTVTYEGFGRDLTVGILDLSAFRSIFRIVGSDEWEPITKQCSNEWHRTAPARARILCPDCFA